MFCFELANANAFLNDLEVELANCCWFCELHCSLFLNYVMKMCLCRGIGSCQHGFDACYPLLTPDFGTMQNAVKVDSSEKLAGFECLPKTQTEAGDGPARRRSGKEKLWSLGHCHLTSSWKPKLCSEYWDFVSRILFGWLRPQDDLI